MRSKIQALWFLIYVLTVSFLGEGVCCGLLSSLPIFYTITYWQHLQPV